MVFHYHGNYHYLHQLQRLAINILVKMAGDSDTRAAMKTKLLDNCLTTLTERYEKDVSYSMFYPSEWANRS